jgi:hypothetical protein
MTTLLATEIEPGVFSVKGDVRYTSRRGKIQKGAVGRQSKMRNGFPVEIMYAKEMQK